MAPLADALPAAADPDDLLDAFTGWAASGGRALYPAQEEAVLELWSGSNVILDTPTGSGKSLVALGAHVVALAEGRRTYYTAPIKALVSEKFFDLVRELGAGRVGMMTGDAAVNPSAPIICCTAEILANIALRKGEHADVGQVVMDEFHFYADPDRGWAWQVPLLTLPQAQFLLMSATLGPVDRFARELTDRTGRPTAHVRSATRPVPLDFEYRRTALHESIEVLLATGRAPIYLVHFTQQSAVERAQSLMSTNPCTRAEKDAIAEAIGDFRFAPGFGKVLARHLRHGIGVHHAGMLPKYRLLVERLAQAGHLKVICGTDTLGVGINVPIRTVVFTQLHKYDGTSARILSAREFHQIAGRAGRAGYDTAGTVWVQAPDHDVENEKALAKAGDDPKARRKVVRRKPPTKGYVPWDQGTFERLVAAPPEPLTSSFGVSHGLLLNVLDRPGDGCAALRHLLTHNHEARPAQRRHIRRAIAIYRSLVGAEVVERLEHPDRDGRTVRVVLDLQADFALDQPLSPFVLHAVEHLDPGSPTYALDVLSVVESVLDDPGPVLAAQLNRLKADTVAALKAAGVEYEERMEVLDKLEHPKPLREFTYGLFDDYRLEHPWIEDRNVRPKSVARDMLDRAMTFPEYVADYGLARSEGLLLRYLSDAYKALVRTVPEDAKTDEVHDLAAWLRETVRQVDSSLLDEWERLQRVSEEGVDALDALEGEAALPPEPPGVTADARAFKVMVRAELLRRIDLLGRRAWAGLAARDADPGWDAARFAEAMAPFDEEHGELDTGPAARGPALFDVRAGRDRWLVRQVLADADGDHDWALVAAVDLDASDEAGRPVVRTVALGPWEGWIDPDPA
jgi:superfamily II DNA/RNA helicase